MKTKKDVAEKHNENELLNRALENEGGFFDVDDNFYDAKQIKNYQYLLCNTEEERDGLSNVIDLWDSMPKYISKRMAYKESSAIIERFFFYCGKRYRIRVTPALIGCGNVLSVFYPGATEELIEDVLKKIATNQRSGFFNEKTYTSGVVFSIYMIREELRKRGHARSTTEVVHSLMVLSKSNIEIESDDGTMFGSSSYLPVLFTVSKKQWQEDPNSKWIAYFHPMVTKNIDSLQYRQYDYGLLMKYDNQLSRWVYKLLSSTFLNASIIVPYKVRFSSIKRDSGLLDQERVRDAIKRLEMCFDVLLKSKVLASIEREEVIGLRKKILDVLYVLNPHPSFVGKVKAANKRKMMQRDMF